MNNQELGEVGKGFTAEYPSVIVRGYGCEPAILAVHRVNRATGYIYVAKPWATKPVGFRSSDVFEYDDWMFTKLKRAYESKDQTALMQLYNEAAPFLPTLIKQE